MIHNMYVVSGRKVDIDSKEIQFVTGLSDNVGDREKSTDEYEKYVQLVGEDGKSCDSLQDFLSMYSENYYYWYDPKKEYEGTVEVPVYEDVDTVVMIPTGEHDENGDEILEELIEKEEKQTGTKEEDVVYIKVNAMRYETFKYTQRLLLIMQRLRNWEEYNIDGASTIVDAIQTSEGYNLEVINGSYNEKTGKTMIYVDNEVAPFLNDEVINPDFKKFVFNGFTACVLKDEYNKEDETLFINKGASEVLIEKTILFSLKSFWEV